AERRGLRSAEKEAYESMVVEALTEFRNAVEAADESLEDEMFRPDRSADWLAKKRQVDELAALVEGELLTAYRALAESPEAAEVRATLAYRAVSTLGEVAALSFL